MVPTSVRTPTRVRDFIKFFIYSLSVLA